MATSVNLSDTFNLITNLWPDMSFRKEDLQSGNPEFVIKLYAAFIAKLTDEILFCIKEEAVYDEFDDIEDFDKQVMLYCKLSKVLKKMQYSSPYLIDFYKQNAKKTHTFIKISIHFMTYINNSVDEIQGILNKILDKLGDYKNLTFLKEQNLIVSGANAENLGRLADIYENLEAQIERMKQTYKQMLADKAEAENLLQNKTTELNSINSEIDNLEDELMMLESKERELKEAVITDAEFESLKNTERCLAVELDQCERDGVPTDFVNETTEKQVMYEKWARMFMEIELDPGPVESLHALRKQANENSYVVKELKDELHASEQFHSSRTQRIEMMRSRLDEIEALYAETEKKVQAEEVRDEKAITVKAAECSAHFEEYNKVNTAIEDEKSADLQLQQEEAILDAAVAVNYRKILKSDKNVTNVFNQMLLDLEKRASGSQK